MNDLKPSNPGARAPAGPALPSSAAGSLNAAVADRLAHLFRLSSRCGRIHPLQHLLQRYRAGERS